MAQIKCCWCGEDLGYEGDSRDLDTCGKRECTREMNNMIRDEQEDRQEGAREDEYSRWNGI